MESQKSDSFRCGSRATNRGKENRRSSRNNPLIRDVLIGWQENGNMAEMPASLQNVSLHGCLVKCAKRPLPERSDFIWFKVPDVASSEWIEGILIEAKKPFLSDCSIRIKFLESLSYATFKHLIYGPDPEWVQRDEAFEQEMDQVWKSR
jgi:hypothetical protein